MQEKIEGISSHSSIKQYVVFLVLMGAAVLFFSLCFLVSMKQNRIGGMIGSALLVFAGLWQAYRVYQNIKMKDGVLRIDSEFVTWELNGKEKKVSLSDIERLSSWTGFTVLKDHRGRELISFPENQDNYNEILERLTHHIQTKHNQSR